MAMLLPSEVVAVESFKGTGTVEVPCIVGTGLFAAVVRKVDVSSMVRFRKSLPILSITILKCMKIKELRTVTDCLAVL